MNRLRRRLTQATPVKKTQILKPYITKLWDLGQGWSRVQVRAQLLGLRLRSKIYRCLPVGSYPTLVLGYLLFYTADPNRNKTRYPEQG